MIMDALDEKLLEAYPGKVVRKDLLHEVKKGTNVPSFVLEFLLARFCASDDEEEINAGKEAVLETLQKSYVRPDEANKAQSMVQQKGKHKFIDKVQVTYVEREKRHWGEMENFNSKRIAINERFYKDNERLLEGGVWAEVTLGHNDIEDDDYAFFIDDLRPIQLSRFDFDGFIEERSKFTRDEWMDAVLRTIGLEPTGMEQRLKLHFIMRLLPFVEQNYNFIELGPRGNGKSYTYSEFSPYCTLLSGSQPSASTLFYNNARRKVGVIGFWDVVGFDEISSMKVKDQDTIQLMKDYMANGRFSRGTEVIANASMAFVGNIDDSISTIVQSSEQNLFKPLPKAFDLAILHRMYMYLPGWEVPEPGSHMLTSNFGFITDYLAEAMHYLWKNVNRASFVQQNCKFGSHVVGRDEKAAIKTISGFLKLLHPDGKVEPHELTQYVEYALEGRRRVKEQLYKAKPDDEFDKFEFSYFNEDGKEVVVHCPESKGKIVVPGKSPASGGHEEVEKGRPSDPVDTPPIPELEQPWSKGESDTVEYKATLRRNLYTGAQEPEMGFMALKTIAAFLNTKGGYLVIGMEDDGNAVGVDADKFKSEDKMSLHLVSLVKSYLGSLAMTFSDIQFEDYQGKRVMVVKCRKSSKTTFYKDKDTDRESFFIRTGPSTTRLSASETQEYIRQARS
jgi:ATP-dependent Lon protease